MKRPELNIYWYVRLIKCDEEILDLRFALRKAEKKKDGDAITNLFKDLGSLLRYRKEILKQIEEELIV